MAKVRPTFSTKLFQHALDSQVRQYWSSMKVHELTVNRAGQRCRLHACLRHALRLARWAGFFPVQGLGQTCANGTRFKIKSFYSCYYIATLIGQVVMSFFSIWYFSQNEVDLSTISNMIFYVTGLISAILLLKLSQQWPQVMAKATETEQDLTELKLENKTVVQTTVLAYVVMALALVEHLLCMRFNIKFVMNCLQEAGITSNVMENYFIQMMPYVFNYVPYSIFSALIFEFMCLQATFLWSFNDLMITCFSIYITAYFQNFNKVMATNAKKKKDGLPWSVLRVHYSNLVKLVKEIDFQISSFILLSFFTDLFYICLQLFNSLHRNHVGFKFCNEAQTKQALSSPYYLMYYLFSFIFLVLRALMLSLFASNVHSVSLEPVYSVYDIPSSAYDIEVVSTIITYEIVLLQYSITPVPYFNSTTVENITSL